MTTASLIKVLKNTNNASDESAQRMNERVRDILRKRGIFAI